MGNSIFSSAPVKERIEEESRLNKTELEAVRTLYNSFFESNGDINTSAIKLSFSTKNVKDFHEMLQMENVFKDAKSFEAFVIAITKDSIQSGFTYTVYCTRAPSA